MKNTRIIGISAVVAAGTLALAACGSGGGNAGSVRADGSSTVAPFTSAAAEMFRAQNPDINVTVGTSGTGGGFEKFCRGETDISDASREIKDSEIAVCEQNGVTWEKMVVANDAIAIVVNNDNDWARCLTTEQLSKIWEPGSKVSNWNQVDKSFPDVPLQLFGPGTDSGTFDYFTEEINGEEGASRPDYTASEDDNQIVQGVSGSRGGLGYFGYTYYEENSDRLRVVEVDNGDGCVTPSPETVQDDSYSPLARPLFIYAATSKLTTNPALLEFLDYIVANDGEIASASLFIPLSPEQSAELAAQWAAAQAAAGVSAAG